MSASPRLSSDCPVENVSWNDVQLFLEKLNEQSKLIFRLPTVVEWEHAAHGGNSENTFKFSGSDVIDEVAWYSHNSGMCSRPVGRKKPNRLGFYDMCGNVSEWCADSFVPEPPPGSLRYEDPSDYLERCRAYFTDKEIYRALKGGDWQSDPDICTINHLGGLPSEIRHHAAGFRLAATI